MTATPDSELLLLRWNSYENNFSTAFGDLRESPKYQDVTLAVEDGHTQAHRVLVSACSPVLAKILDINSHPNPLLYLKGIYLKDLTALLDFMYKGEVHVSNDDLEQFLATAEELKVKGLSEIPETVQLSQPFDSPQHFLKEDITPGKMCTPTLITPKIIAKDKIKELKRKADEEGEKGDKPLGYSTPKIRKIGIETKVLEENVEVGKKMNDVIDDVIVNAVQASPVNGKLQVHDESSEGHRNNFSSGTLQDNEIDEVVIDDDDDDEFYAGKIIITRSDEDRKKYRSILDGMVKQNPDDLLLWECLECDRKFTGKCSRSNAMSHVDHIHTGHILHRCPECGMMCKNNDALTRHIQKRHKQKLP